MIPEGRILVRGWEELDQVLRAAGYAAEDITLLTEVL